MDVLFERINEEHFEALVALFKEFALFEKQPDKMMMNSVEKMHHEKDFIQGYVAKDQDNRIVGYVTFFFAYYTWSGKALYMDDLYVRNENRGQGIGTDLIHKAVEYARSHECYKLRWQVSDWNDPAIVFYSSLGASIDHVEMNCDLLMNDYIRK